MNTKNLIFFVLSAILVLITTFAFAAPIAKVKCPKLSSFKVVNLSSLYIEISNSHWQGRIVTEPTPGVNSKKARQLAIQAIKQVSEVGYAKGVDRGYYCTVTHYTNLPEGVLNIYTYNNKGK